MKLWQVLSDIPVSEDDLRRATAAIAEELDDRPAGTRDFNARAGVLERLFTNPPNKALAVNFRLQALGQLSDHPQMRAWTVQDPATEAKHLAPQSTLFAAAAEEPLVEIGGEIGFDPDAFFARALSLAGDAGSA